MNEFILGYDSYQRNKGKTVPFIWDPLKLANGHVGVTGTSGSGKTYQIRRFAEAYANALGTKVSIFDYHGDIEVTGACEVLFSEATRYGYNPFIVNPDPHYGGLRKSANHIIEIMSSNRKLGEQQSAVLRTLINDCYAMKWMDPDKPQSWVRRNASDTECDQLFKERKWAELGKCFPTLTDLDRLIKRKLKSGLFGLDDNNQSSAALRQFEAFLKSAKTLTKAKEKNLKDDSEKALEALEKAKTAALEEYGKALEVVRTGTEFEEMLKYDCVDTLKSLLLRLDNVRALGLFNSNEPPFHGNIHRYNIKPMATSEHELKMFVYNRMMSIFYEEMQRGESNGQIRHVIILDEAKRFCDDNPSNPINIIANEARKFGIALILASQSPTHFSDDFINSAGTLLVQNMASGDWPKASTKLQIDKSKLEYLKPRQTAVLKLQEVGKASKWYQLDFNAGSAA